MNMARAAEWERTVEMEDGKEMEIENIARESKRTKESKVGQERTEWVARL